MGRFDTVGPEDWSGISRIGEKISGALTQDAQRRDLQALGERIAAGDYAGATQAAFQSGDLKTGLSLLKMQQANDASRRFDADFGGGSAPAGNGFNVPPAPGQRAPAMAGGNAAMRLP